MPVPAAPASSPSGLGAAGILASRPDPSTIPPNLHLNTQFQGQGQGHGYGGYGAGDTPPVSAGTTGSGNAIGVVTGAYGAGMTGPVRPGITRRETFDERRKEREYQRVRRNSAAEKSLEQFRSGIDYVQTMRGVDPTTTSPRALRFQRTQNAVGPQDGATGGLTRDREDRHRRLSLQQPAASNNLTSSHRNSSISTMISHATSSHFSSTTGAHGAISESKSNSYGESGSGAATPTPVSGAVFRNFAVNRMSRSPSTPMVYPKDMAPPDGLRELLDGTRHADELGVMFEAGWPLMEQWLSVIGGGKGDGDFGRVALIIR